MKRAVLLTNLGTPSAPEPGPVRRFLREFLSDPRVIELPRWLWLPILQIILLIRPRRIAPAYASIWTDAGSPLMAISKRQAAALQERLGDDYKVVLGMRYGEPSLADAVSEAGDVDELTLLPLYPQYSATTTASTFDALAGAFANTRAQPALRTIRDYHDHPAYIDALAKSVLRHWAANGRPSRFLMSYHGLPEPYCDAGDPYFKQCRRTSELLAAALELDETDWSMAFQSRVGREEWLKPYTETTLQEWGRIGAERVDVLCPGFAADCLETLEEIAIRNREDFIAAGGGDLQYIPALNDSPAHIDLLEKLVRNGD